MPHPFLSDEWIAAARDIHAEYRGRTPRIEHPVRMNLVVTDVPFGAGAIDAHVDTTSGEMEIDLGHLDGVDVTLTLDYPTARAVLVEQDAQGVMQAFMGGRIKVQGDLAKVIILQGQVASPDAVALEVAGRVRDITA